MYRWTVRRWVAALKRRPRRKNLVIFLPALLRPLKRPKQPTGVQNRLTSF